MTLPETALLVRGMSNQVATSTEIVYAFMEHTGRTSLDSGWRVNAETYINNVVLTVDQDYYMGYLLECVDRTEGTVSFVAVALYHGRSKETGLFEHDFISYQPKCGTFFERTDAADHCTVGQWAVSVIFGMFESHEQELERKRRVPTR